MNQIYKISNSESKKVYIGLTTQGVNRRWSEHLSRFNLGERDHKLYLAMRKHGIDNFKIEVIHETDDSNELADLEIKYIREHDSFNNGYNMTIGGDVVSDETREKLSKIFTGRNITWGQKIVDTKRQRFDQWPCGRLSGPDNTTSKKYSVKRPSGEIENIHGLRHFCRENNLSHNLLLATLKGTQTHHKGYVLLARFNDYHESGYTQAGGSGECPVALAG